jgi:hypothetical protein
LSHKAGSRFWRHFDSLPEDIQKLAHENFELLKSDPRHPSLRFKRVGRYWSVRIGRSFRALGVEVPAGIRWFWIGPHEEYKRLVRD